MTRGVRVPAVGLLYPGYGAQDDFPTYQRRADDRLRLPLVHTSVGVDAHAVGPLLDLGGADRLAEGATRLLAADPDSLMWACTSGSFVFGWDGAARQVEALAGRFGRPVSSTSLAFVHAAHHLGLRSVAVAASYPADIAALFEEFLSHGGITVTRLVSHGLSTAAEVGRLDRAGVLDLVGSAVDEAADAVLVPDTALHSLAWIEDLEQAAGRPVLTANQVTIWEGLRLLGADVPSRLRLPGLGALFGPEPARRARTR